MQHDTLRDLVNGRATPISGTNAGARRAQQFRQALLDAAITEPMMQRLLNAYVSRHKKPASDKATAQANLAKELAQPEISEKVLQRGLDLLAGK